MTIMRPSVNSRLADGHHKAARQETTANSGEPMREEAEERRWQAEWDRRNVED